MSIAFEALLMTYRSLRILLGVAVVLMVLPLAVGQEAKKDKSTVPE